MSGAAGAGRIVARQPILDRKKRLYGYELLFRGGLDNFFRADDGDAASRDVADNLFTSGPAVLTSGRVAFINCTREFLVNDYASLLPQDKTAIEVLETIEPDRAVLSALARLKAAGYLIVLDDFVFSEKFQPLVNLADLIKVDFLATPASERKLLPKQFAHDGLKLLAEKVETNDQFDEAAQAGYSYFQGYFFCRPQIVAGTSIPAYKLRYLDLLRALTRTEVDTREVESIIERDISLSYKLLRLANSALFGFASEVRSIGQVLILLGENELRKWAAVAVLLTAAQDKPHELMRTSLIRARFCELLAPMLRGREDGPELFLMGLFSLLDALLGRPMDELVSEIALPEEIRIALSGGDNLQRKVCLLMESYERADWPEVSHCAYSLGLDEALLFQAYLESVRWATISFDSALDSGPNSVRSARRRLRTAITHR